MLKDQTLKKTRTLPSPEGGFFSCDIWGVAKGSSISWVARFKGDKHSECKLSYGWSRNYREIKVLLFPGKRVVAKLQGDKSAHKSSMELYYPWKPPGPLRVS